MIGDVSMDSFPGFRNLAAGEKEAIECYQKNGSSNELFPCNYATVNLVGGWIMDLRISIGP